MNQYNDTITDEILHKLSDKPTGITSDPNAVQPGMIYILSTNNNSEKPTLIDKAIRNGAIAVIVEKQTTNLTIKNSHTTSRIIEVVNPRLIFAKLAARVATGQPESIIAITGTTGKTSVVEFTRQLFNYAGLAAASIGTLGVIHQNDRTIISQLTTPDPVSIHKILSKLAADKITHVAMEASSHGLHQHRLDGVTFSAAAFTNLSQDHQDYHKDMESYFKTKMRLFNELIGAGTACIVNVDTYWGRRAAQQIRSNKLELVDIGFTGKGIRILRSHKEDKGQILELNGILGNVTIRLPLIGRFQAINALIAAALAIKCSIAPLTVVAGMETLKTVIGRLELVGKKANGALIFVDYAHNPEGIRTVLETLRLLTKSKLVIVFGCGGDRDTEKRPVMYRVARSLADVVIVTDDNPRSEDPECIRRQILLSADDALEIADRAKAIFHGVQILEAGDVLVVAGKGHETFQTIGDQMFQFSDHKTIKMAILQCTNEA